MWHFSHKMPSPTRYKAPMPYRPPPGHLPPQAAPQPLPAAPLAATIDQVSGWWIEVHCVCGRRTAAYVRQAASGAADGLQRIKAAALRHMRRPAVNPRARRNAWALIRCKARSRRAFR